MTKPSISALQRMIALMQQHPKATACEVLAMWKQAQQQAEQSGG